MLKIKIEGVEKTMTFLKTFADGFEDISVEAVAEWMIGNDAHGLKHEPYYKYVNRYAGFPNASYTTSTGKEVYGYSSAKQHRYVMAAIARGEIKPGQDNRTHNFQDNWNMTGENGKYVIQNATSYGKYLMGENNQTRMHSLIGWRRVSQVIQDNIMGAFRHARAAVNKFIRESRQK